jgi:hypothetical protein
MGTVPAQTGFPPFLCPRSPLERKQSRLQADETQAGMSTPAANEGRDPEDVSSQTYSMYCIASFSGDM